MANPQPDQFTKVSNEVLENVMQYGLNGTQLRIIMCVWRYTYGFSRKSAKLSISFIARAINIPPRNVRKEIIRMIEAKILIEFVKPDKNKTREIGFNKDYDQWMNYTRGSIRPQGQLDPRPEDELDLRTEGQLDPQERKPKESNKENIKERILAHWNSLKIIVHRNLTPDISKALDKVIKDPEYFITCMDHYATAFHDESYEYCSYAWSLDSFIDRKKGYRLFADDGEKWINYKSNKKKSKPSQKSYDDIPALTFDKPAMYATKD